jgi:hypothetical protein
MAMLQVAVVAACWGGGERKKWMGRWERGKSREREGNVTLHHRAFF